MIGASNYSDDFKRDAVAQITEQGYPLRGFRAPGRQQVLTLRMEAQIHEARVRRGR